MKPRIRGCVAVLFCCVGVSNYSQATDPTQNMAEFQVTGTLLESACYLDPSSAYQELVLGEQTTARLSELGQGTPMALQLKLQGCVRVNGGRRDENDGNLVWSAIEPVATLTFNAVSDADNPELIKVVGADGFGLRLLDAHGHDVRLGRSASAWFVSPGSSQLTYFILPERTVAPLRPGSFRATLNVSLAYD